MHIQIENVLNAPQNVDGTGQTKRSERIAARDFYYSKRIKRMKLKSKKNKFDIIFASSSFLWILSPFASDEIEWSAAQNHHQILRVAIIICMNTIPMWMCILNQIL